MFFTTKLSFLFFLLNAQAFTQNSSDSYLSEVASAQKEAIKSETFIIEKIDLGAACPGKNKFTAVIKNRTNSPLKIALDLRAEPGLW